ncbi:MAG: EamA family transporter [Deltaproteobacteria bacterium]|nr:MAG: EamA family transporter [Deltaproteobacteria bacterium]
MRRFFIVGFVILLGFDTLAQIGFKLAAVAAAPPELGLQWIARIATEKWIYLAVAGYLGAFITWMTLLQYAPIGPAFATSHLDIVTVLFVSVVLLGESLSRPQIVGAALILIGIAVLAVTKSKEPERGELRDHDAA